METLEAMGTRRSIRYFYPWKYVEDEKIQTILEAARRASHWGNVFVWRCIVVDKKKASPEIITAAEEGGYNQVQVQQAPLILYFVVDRAKWAEWKDACIELYDLKAINPSHGWSHQMIDEITAIGPDFNPSVRGPMNEFVIGTQEASLAVQNAYLAAVDQGLGVCLFTSSHEDIGKTDSKLKKALNLPDTADVSLGMAIGYPAEGKEAGGQRPRPPFAEMFYEETWGNGMKLDPNVEEELKNKRLIQRSIKDNQDQRTEEVKHLSRMFGLPE